MQFYVCIECIKQKQKHEHDTQTNKQTKNKNPKNLTPNSESQEEETSTVSNNLVSMAFVSIKQCVCVFFIQYSIFL